MKIAATLRALLAAPLLLAGASVPSGGWDKLRWGMTLKEARQRYPNAEYKDGWTLRIDRANIAKTTPLATLIEPASVVIVHFDVASLTAPLTAHNAMFATLGEFNDVAKVLQGKYGPPVSGKADENACFNKDGQRIVEDIGGFDRVLQLCLGEAVFVDRKAGNAIYLGHYDVHWAFRPINNLEPYQVAQIVMITAIRNCPECGKP